MTSQGIPQSPGLASGSIDWARKAILWQFKYFDVSEKNAIPMVLQCQMSTGREAEALGISKLAGGEGFFPGRASAYDFDGFLAIEPFLF